MIGGVYPCRVVLLVSAARHDGQSSLRRLVARRPFTHAGT